MLVLNNSNKSISLSRRVIGNDRSIPYPEIDIMLKNWVQYMNKKGLVIKNKYLKNKTLSIERSLDITKFSYSGGYIYKIPRKGTASCQEPRLLLDFYLTMPKIWLLILWIRFVFSPGKCMVCFFPVLKNINIINKKLEN
ncbi:hypothetical protein DMUE_0410 [Dictyocoela muelleri]|nr:hypothetical protein DMUE_0410 [Dictyocoela muelleri]